MQSNIVKAFRQRLIRAGFTDVTIFNCYNGSYYVSCFDSKGNFIREVLTEVQMRNRPFCVWVLN